MKSSKDVFPAAYFKRLAKKLKKEKQVPHHVALDMAVAEEGFSNWKHYLNSGSMATVVPQIKMRIPVPATISFPMFPRKKVIKPNAKMPLNAHSEIASLLNYVLINTYQYKGVQKAIGIVRSELDDWVQKEYPHGTEMTDEMFQSMYYASQGTTDPKKLLSSNEVLKLRQNLEKACTILGRHYHDCKPLRELFALIEKATLGLGKPTVTKMSSHRRYLRGTFVRIKSQNEDAVVVAYDEDKDLLDLFGSSGRFQYSPSDVSIYRTKTAVGWRPMRLYMPYGKWVCGDGSEVLFNRDYHPIWAKLKSGEVIRLEPKTWVKHEEQHYFFDDGSSPWRKKKTVAVCDSILKSWGVDHLEPKTIENFHRLIQTGEDVPTPGAQFP